MSIPIRIHNDGTKEIRVVQLDQNERAVLSYRIPPNSLSPTLHMEDPSRHSLVAIDDEHLVAIDPMGKEAEDETPPTEPNHAEHSPKHSKSKQSAT